MASRSAVNHRWPITPYLILAFFPIPHEIDEFLLDIPAEFGIPMHLSQFLPAGGHTALKNSKGIGE